MNKKWIFLIILVVIIFIAGVVVYRIDMNRMENNEPVLFSTWGKDYSVKEENKTDVLNNEDQNTLTDVQTDAEENGLNVVLSLEDEISNNSVWCGTFNLVWNDLKNNVAKQDIVFTPQLKIAENLNKGTFNTNYLSEESYYKIHGYATKELKEKIEKDIKEKFNEKSDILDSFEWPEEKGEQYFLYAMLKKKFKFPMFFSRLEDDSFGEYDNVKYFGIDETTQETVRDQVQVLYYESKDNFAVKLTTKQNDEVIISRGTKENTYIDIYNEIMENAEKYNGSTYFTEEDILQIPNINFDIKENIDDFTGREFLYSDGTEHEITQAMQTIQFELNEKGGEIKSEAGMMVDKLAINTETEKREFIVDDTFTIFLKEKDKELPYFAATISDITQVQENANK